MTATARAASEAEDSDKEVQDGLAAFQRSLKRYSRYISVLKILFTYLKISSYFNTSKFSDFIIRTADSDLKAYKIVISGQSECFSRMFDEVLVVSLESL
jgi:uncharacterized membrane protein YjjP (DUF1212 family)